MLEKSFIGYLGPGCREFESRHSDQPVEDDPRDQLRLVLFLVRKAAVAASCEQSRFPAINLVLHKKACEEEIPSQAFSLFIAVQFTCPLLFFLKLCLYIKHSLLHF